MGEENSACILSAVEYWIILVCHDTLLYNHQFCSDRRSFFTNAPLSDAWSEERDSENRPRLNFPSLYLSSFFQIGCGLVLKISLIRLLPLSDIWDCLWFVTKLDGYSSSLLRDCIMSSFLCHPCGKSFNVQYLCNPLCTSSWALPPPPHIQPLRLIIMFPEVTKKTFTLSFGQWLMHNDWCCFFVFF